MIRTAAALGAMLPFDQLQRQSKQLMEPGDASRGFRRPNVPQYDTVSRCWTPKAQRSSETGAGRDCLDHPLVFERFEVDERHGYRAEIGARVLGPNESVTPWQ